MSVVWSLSGEKRTWRLRAPISELDPQQTSTVGGKRPRGRNFLRDLKVVVLKQASKRQRLRLVRAGARSRWPQRLRRVVRGSRTVQSSRGAPLLRIRRQTRRCYAQCGESGRELRAAQLGVVGQPRRERLEWCYSSLSRSVVRPESARAALRFEAPWP